MKTLLIFILLLCVQLQASDAAEKYKKTKNEPSKPFEPGPISEASVKHIKELGEIIKKYKTTEMKDAGARCTEFATLLQKYSLGSDLIEIKGVNKSDVYNVTTSFSLPSFDDWFEHNYELVSILFQSCNFLPTYTFPMGLLAQGGEIQRLMTQATISQKIGDNKYMAITKRMSFVAGRPVPTLGKNLVVTGNDKIKGTGDISIFPIKAGAENHTMLNGFDKEIRTVVDLGIERTSAVMCRWSEYMKTMKKRYGNKFKCGYRLNGPNFESTNSISFLCTDAKNVKSDGSVKGSPYYLADWDWPYCK